MFFLPLWIAFVTLDTALSLFDLSMQNVPHVIATLQNLFQLILISLSITLDIIVTVLGLELQNFQSCQANKGKLTSVDTLFCKRLDIQYYLQRNGYSEEIINANLEAMVNLSKMMKMNEEQTQRKESNYFALTDMAISFLGMAKVSKEETSHDNHQY